jgi:hypothetical protein
VQRIADGDAADAVLIFDRVDIDPGAGGMRRIRDPFRQDLRDLFR